MELLRVLILSWDVGVPSSSTGSLLMAALSILSSGRLNCTGETGTSDMAGKRQTVIGLQYRVKHCLGEEQLSWQ